MESQDTSQFRPTFAGKLKAIDEQLERFAVKYKTQVYASVGGHYSSTGDSPPADSLEHRMIDWKDSNMSKAIIIQPHSDTSGIKTDAWDVCVIAWLADAPSFKKPFSILYVSRNASIKTLVLKIDEWLIHSEEKLKNMKVEDFKTTITYSEMRRG